MQAFLCVSIFGRMMYFMQIIDQIAPLIKIIFLIFSDIKWFVVLYVITVFAFSSSFELLGKNQEMFRKKTDDAGNPIEFSAPYIGTFNAFVHVYRIGLGDFDNDAYVTELSDDSLRLSSYFYIFWFFCGFLLQIHLLNMLIAIMGETFSKNNETKDIQTTRSHLAFVMDNWFIDPIKNKNRIKYLVVAFAKEEENVESEMLMKLLEN